MTGDGTRTFEWDAENRLTAVNNGTHRSEFSYDGIDRRIRIVEKENSVVTTDTRFLWCGEELCEERDSTGATTTKRFFPQGEQQGIDNSFYTRDHLSSIRELIDDTGAIRARYDYDPYGRTNKISGDKDTTFRFTGHYFHNASELELSLFRVYDPSTSRWMSEDPIGFLGGPNFFAYATNRPSSAWDPYGLDWRVDFVRNSMIVGSIVGTMVGAGGGGFMLLYCPFDRKHGVAETLRAQGCAVSDLAFSTDGVETWTLPED